MDPHRRRQLNQLERFETNCVDLSGSGMVLGQAAVLASKTVRRLGSPGQDMVIDMCSPYRAAVQQVPPHDVPVADRFHLVRLANDMVTEVRTSGLSALQC